MQFGASWLNLKELLDLGGCTRSTDADSTVELYFSLSQQWFAPVCVSQCNLEGGLQIVDETDGTMTWIRRLLLPNKDVATEAGKTPLIPDKQASLAVFCVCVCVCVCVFGGEAMWGPGLNRGPPSSQGSPAQHR